MQKIRWEMVMEGSPDTARVMTPTDLLPMIEELNLHTMDREAVSVFMLNAAQQVIGHETVSIGTVNMAIAAPREIFKAAIVRDAVAIIVTHNHPSGNVTPSDQDIALTRGLVQAGKLLSVCVLDHIIIGPTKNFCSMRACGGGDKIFS